MEWIGKLYQSYPLRFRRVIIDSRILRRSIKYAQRRTIILVLLLKIVKGMLYIRDAYTVRYLKQCGLLAALR